MTRKLNERGLEAAVVTFLQKRNSPVATVGEAVEAIIRDYLDVADMDATLEVKSAAQAQMDNLNINSYYRSNVDSLKPQGVYYPTNSPLTPTGLAAAAKDGKAKGKQQADRTWREWGWYEPHQMSDSPYRHNRVEITRREWDGRVEVIDPRKGLSPYTNVAGLLWRPYEEFPND